MKLYEKAIKQLEKEKPKVTIEDNTAKKIIILHRLLRAEYGFSDQTKEETTTELLAEYNENLINEVTESIKQHGKQRNAPYHMGLKLAADKVNKRGGKQQ